MIYYTHRYTGAKGESRELLRKAIGQHTGEYISAEELKERSMTVGEYGKPAVSGCSEFSISHNGTTWAVLFADAKCGLDVQYSRKCDVFGIAERFYDAEDAEAVIKAGTRDDDGAAKEFFRIWARREALIKAAGSSVADSHVPAVNGSEAFYEGHRWLIRDISFPGGPGGESISAAICVENDQGSDEWPDDIADFRELDLR